MQSDSASKLPDAPRRELWQLPQIESLRIERVHYIEPRRRTIAGQLTSIREAIEFIVITAGQIPIRALSPALFVGKSEVAENETLGPNEYRFVAFEGQSLAAGAAIQLGWVGHPPQQSKVRFRYQSPEGVARR